MIFNELKQSIWKKTILERKLRHMLKEKNEIHQKMNMIWIYENVAHFKPFKSP
jgi:hypothetical protein